MNTAAVNTKADADREDVARVLAGEVRAFENIVLRWQAPLINLAWRYTRDRSRAEEMAQEAFLRAWRNLKSWRGECRFSSWLFALATNLYRNELKRIPMQLLPVDYAPEPSLPAAQLEMAMKGRRCEDVRSAVLALPMHYREPVILYYFFEMDLAMAAATLKMPEGTFKARLSRARKILRERFPQLRDEIAHVQTTTALRPKAETRA